MRYTLTQIADAIGAVVVGDANLVVTGLSEPQSAKADDLALATNSKYAQSLSQGAAKAALLWDGADWQALGLLGAIIPNRPRFAMAGLSKLADQGQGFGGGIHPMAIVDPSAKLGANVSVGPFSIVMQGAEIGDNTVIGPQCFVGMDARIGRDGFLREGGKIGSRVVIGDRFIGQPNIVIGGDGFSFVTEDVSNVENVRATLGDQGDAKSQSWTRIHSLGAVSIGDDVEIGAGCAIDKGTIRSTRIGDRTKLDNLVHIGHNVVIGNDCLICGQVGIAGSSTVGNNVVLAGQTGVNDNIFIGDNVIAGGASKIFTNVPSGRAILGSPAMKMETHVESYKAIRRLPRLFRDVAAIKAALGGASDGE